MERHLNPEEILAMVKEEERKQTHGKLKIYLGAAPGVGKTYTMLQDALAQRRDGLDVVVGVVEPHGRKETEKLLQGLETFPRLTINYHGKEFLELDLDGILKRQPALVLVDEMAHTNTTGTRHPKRWQDIKELLDRGINVYTTLNVQHIESLNDIVAQITGVIVRETVPDNMIEQADAIELIDLPPEDLLKRLAEGKVYVPNQAEIAIQNFFRKGNLTALRELALRLTAQQVNAQVFLHRRGESIKRIWPTVERLLVCISPDPSAAKLIRATYRMAKSLHAEWLAIYVEAPRLHLTKQQRENALQNLRLAEQLGGETITLSGKDIVHEITSFARLRNVTKIIMGKHLRPRWKTLLFGSLVDELVRNSGEIELYIIHGDADGAKLPKTNAPNTTTTSWFEYAISIMTVGVCTLFNFFLSSQIGLCNIVMVYLLGIIFMATRGRFMPSLITSLLSVIAFDFFFLPPQFSFALIKMQYATSIALMLMISQVINHLIITNQQQIEAAHERELRTATMYILSRRLASVRGLDNLLQVAMGHINEVFDSHALVLLPDANKHLEIRAGQHIKRTLTPKEQSVAQWVYDLGQIAGLGTQTLPDSEAIYIPLQGTHGTVGVLRVLPEDPSSLQTPDQLHLLEGFANQIALAIEVDQLEEEAKQSALKNQADRLRGALLKSVSHNLQIPLLEIMAASNDLLQKKAFLPDTTTHTSIKSIARYTEQLNRLMNNLLQMTQLETDPHTLQKELHSLKEVIDRALYNLDGLIENKKIVAHYPENFPLILFEPVLLEQVFIQLLDNAIKYSPAKSIIEITTLLETNHVKICIANQGPGLTSEELQKVFDKFYRGQTNNVGMGLGLTICQSIINAHGGRIWVENQQGDGVIFYFTLPLR